MRARTMSQMFFRGEDGKYTMYRDERNPDLMDPPPAGEKGERGRKKDKGKGKTPLPLIPIEDVDPIKLRWQATFNRQQEPTRPL